MDHDPDRNLLTISARNHFGPDRVPGPNLIKFCRVFASSVVFMIGRRETVFERRDAVLDGRWPAGAGKEGMRREPENTSF